MCQAKGGRLWLGQKSLTFIDRAFRNLETKHDLKACKNF